MLDPTDAPDPTRTYCRARRLFLAVLGALTAAAFVSFWRSFPSIVGSRGVLPIEETVAGWRAAGEPFLQHPTLLWLVPADFALHGLCALGVLCGLGLVAGLAPRWLAFVAWGSYLSLFHAGEEFMGSWDVLLLECLFLAGFFAPGGWRPGERWGRSGQPAAHWLLRWLLFRVLAQGVWSRLATQYALWVEDPRAVEFALFAEPLPTPAGLWLHGAAGGDVLQWLTIGWLVLDVVLAVAVLGPRWARRLAVVPLVLHFSAQWLLFHHGWTAPLCIALSLLLLDDGILRRKELASPAPGGAWRMLGWAGAAAFAFVSFLQWTVMSEPAPATRTGVWKVLHHTRRFATCNSYPHLGTVATAQRVWIFEGRESEASGWHPYEWQHLPGRTDRGPSWMPLHVPRLEYAMAFAPTPNAPQQLNGTWHYTLLRRLFEREPAVLSAFSELPFDTAPALLRIAHYAYYPAAPDSSDVWRRGLDPDFGLSGEIAPADVGAR